MVIVCVSRCCITDTDELEVAARHLGCWVWTWDELHAVRWRESRAGIKVPRPHLVVAGIGKRTVCGCLAFFFGSQVS
jgi:hypothetical protein